MEQLGLLRVVGQDEVREVGACAALKSTTRPENKPVNQGMHSDMTPSWEWGHRFGLSSITAGSKPAAVDIYPASFSGERAGGQPVRVWLEPGETLVFLGVARHRGVSYPYLSLRFFVSLVVKSEVEVARVGAFETTDMVEKASRPEREGELLTFEDWQELIRNM